MSEYDFIKTALIMLFCLNIGFGAIGYIVRMALLLKANGLSKVKKLRMWVFISLEPVFILYISIGIQFSLFWEIVGDLKGATNSYIFNCMVVLFTLITTIVFLTKLFVRISANLNDWGHILFASLGGVTGVLCVNFWINQEISNFIVNNNYGVELMIIHLVFYLACYFIPVSSASDFLLKKITKFKYLNQVFID